MEPKKDLTGKQFNRWNVIEWCSEGKYSGSWLCECSCKNKTRRYIKTYNLTSGATKSCGCLRDETTAKRSKSKSLEQCKQALGDRFYELDISGENPVDLSGDFGKLYTASGNEYWFDLEDYDLLKQYRWRTRHDYGRYAFTTNKRKDGTWEVIYMHQLIMGTYKMGYNISVDHIVTENKFDNRKSNLRIVSPKQNSINRKITNPYGISGIRHTITKKYGDRYEARITIDGEEIHLGTYSTVEEATQARLDAEATYQGEYSYLESQKLVINKMENYNKEERCSS